MQAFREAQQLEQELVSLLSSTRLRLRQLYASGLPRPEMVLKKSEVFTQLTSEIRGLEQRAGVKVPLYD